MGNGDLHGVFLSVVCDYVFVLESPALVTLGFKDKLKDYVVPLWVVFYLFVHTAHK